MVTSLTCGLFPLPTILGGGIYCEGAHAKPLMTTWAEWTKHVPEEMCSAFTLLRLPPIPQIPEPLRGVFRARVVVAWTGDPAEGEALLTTIREAAPVAVDTVEEVPYAAIDRIYMEPQDPLPARESCSLIRELPPAAVRAFLAEAGPQATDFPLLIAGLRHLGGALSRPPRTEDAICASDANFLLEAAGVLAAPPAAEAIERATASLHNAMAPYSTGHTMVNIHGTRETPRTGPGPGPRKS